MDLRFSRAGSTRGCHAMIVPLAQMERATRAAQQESESGPRHLPRHLAGSVVGTVAWFLDHGVFNHDVKVEPIRRATLDTSKSRVLLCAPTELVFTEPVVTMTLRTFKVLLSHTMSGSPAQINIIVNRLAFSIGAYDRTLWLPYHESLTYGAVAVLASKRAPRRKAIHDDAVAFELFETGQQLQESRTHPNGVVWLPVDAGMKIST